MAFLLFRAVTIIVAFCAQIHHQIATEQNPAFSSFYSCEPVELDTKSAKRTFFFRRIARIRPEQVFHLVRLIRVVHFISFANIMTLIHRTTRHRPVSIDRTVFIKFYCVFKSSQYCTHLDQFQLFTRLRSLVPCRTFQTVWLLFTFQKALYAHAFY